MESEPTLQSAFDAYFSSKPPNDWNELLMIVGDLGHLWIETCWRIAG